MPELPEVQTVVAQLEAKIVGKKIKSVWSDWSKAVRPSLAVFEKRVMGGVVGGVRRFGKHIVIDLKNHFSIVIHLKMTGHLLVKTQENRESEVFLDPYNQYIHHSITFTDKSTLEFSDMRKFGWMEAMETKSVENFPGIHALGIDALSEVLTPEVFKSLLDKKKKAIIGTILLDQKLIAGIGNIYRSEALFAAGIAPEREVGSLKNDEMECLLRSIQFILRRALTFRGMSDGDFRDTDGKQGSFQKELGVYGRDGKPCPKCDTILDRVKLGQRSVFWCPQCQH